ncbi:MAG: hypothetical protein HKN50_13010 [Gammaproteobacteria bacterium]|nr:hypothetical protein [Gammaproteobacteria bacterium]
MNWEAAGAIGEIVGAIAVFLTLAYLAMQIRQNTDAVRAAALDSSVNALSNIRAKLHDNGELTEIYLRGCDDPQSLTKAELTRFILLITNILWSTLNLYTQSQYANLSASVWESQKPILKRILNTNGGKWYWLHFKSEYEEIFATEIDEIVRS